MMDRSCNNCRFCISAMSMRGKAELYCERHNEWIGDAILCSEWEAVIVPKPLTNADRIRAMSDEELADFLCKVAYNTTPVGYYHIEGWLDWLKTGAEGGGM